MAEINREMMVEMHRTMLRIRTAEGRVRSMFLSGMIPGFLHSYVGEEAVAVGACAALEERDYISSTHRGHGHLIAKGGRLDRMMAELFGKQTGYCRGKGGSMHIADVSLGILGANGIVGAGIPIANGAALTAQMKGTGQVVLCFFGDGAAQQGTFHESVNLASIWDLPIVFVCENNLYAMSTPASYHMNISSVSDRSAGYGIPGVRVEGNEVLEVYSSIREAVERARRGDGPTLVECVTFRHLGHFVGDPEVYLTQEEKDEWMKRDPIELFRRRLLDDGVLDEKRLGAMEREVAEEVEAAVEFAKSSPDPDPGESMEHVYVNWSWGDEYR